LFRRIFGRYFLEILQQALEEMGGLHLSDSEVNFFLTANVATLPALARKALRDKIVPEGDFEYKPRGRNL